MATNQPNAPEFVRVFGLNSAASDPLAAIFVPGYRTMSEKQLKTDRVPDDDDTGTTLYFRIIPTRFGFRERIRRI